MLASVYGHDSIVRYLLDNYSDYCIVDAENYFSQYDVDYDCDDDHLNKQTALWLAIKHSHLNVVQTLVSLSPVNINQKADESCRLPNSYTSLYWACENKQLEMAKYLVDNGADLYDVDIDGSTALMIASSRGQDDMGKYLLSLDESNNRLLNAMDKDGSTALHRAAYSGYISTVKLLLEEYHAKIIKDKEGRTPLTRAGIWNQQEVVKYFVENEKQVWYSTSELIDELELIGSYQLTDGNYRTDGFQQAHDYMLWAMKLRYKDPNIPILKTNLPSPNRAYGNYSECQTIEELELIGENDDDIRLLFECLMIRERNGITETFIRLLHHQADLFASNLYSWNPNFSIRGQHKCQYALQLWLYAYCLQIQTQTYLNQCVFHLEKCVKLMRKLIEQKRTKEIRFPMVMELLQATENEFLRNQHIPKESNINQATKDNLCYSLKQKINKILSETNHNYGDKCLYLIVNLLFIAMKVISSSNKRKKIRRRILIQRVRQLIRSDYRTISDYKTLLHLSLLQSHNNNWICPDIRFPSLSVVKLLLSCQASINAIDHHHYTPLHDFVSNHFEGYTDEYLNEVKRIFEILIDAGAHLDALAEGKSPRDCAAHDKIKNLFEKHPIQLNLRCICARIIRQHEFNYIHRLPTHLHSFVQLH